MSRLDDFRAWWAHAFAVRGREEALSDAERALVERLADLVVRRRMTPVASLLLECTRPLSFLGSQLMQFAKPFATTVFDAEEYAALGHLLERREAVDLLSAAIEEREGLEHE